MSAPTSNGRPSISSDPSATSSHTLTSRYSGPYDDNGESSSSQQPRVVVSRHNSGGSHASQSRSRSSGTYLGAESIEEHDFAHRKQRSKRSGGFLLDSTFPSGPRTRQPPEHAPIEDVKGKHNSHRERNSDRNGSQARIRIGTGASLHHSPLSREVMVADQDTRERNLRVDSTNKQEQYLNGELRVPRTRNSEHGMSAAIHDDGGSEEGQVAPRAIIDPNQIVHMALNLSESRRRNFSAGHLIAPQASSARRVASTSVQQDGSFRNYGTGSSLGQYLNDQRRSSRNISPAGGRNSPSVPRQISTAIPRSASISLQPPNYKFSDATIARRDKARSYIELRIEYLRLLDCLPPLKPDAGAPGNFIVSANNVPGSPHVQLTRVPSFMSSKYELGRAYNPLQYIRNRRNRARERKCFDHPPEEFLDVDQVRYWVDRAEKEAKRPDYRQQDRISLPKYHEDHQSEDRPSRPTRSRMGWIFTPEELLADVYWVEQSDNKSLIEDRHGRKIFPPLEPQKQDFLQPRGSKEYPEKRRGSWVEALPRMSAEIATGDESEPTSERGRKRRLLPPFRSESPKHKKHAWRSAKPQSGNHTDSSESESGSPRRRSRKSRREADINNTGPLELKIREMMEKEAREAEVNTPDTPNKWGHSNIPIDKPSRSSAEVTRLPNGTVDELGYLGLKSPPKRQRSNLALSLDLPLSEPRSSLEGLDSTAPNTPLHPKHFPHIGTDSSRPPSRGDSLPRKPKKNILGVFRSDESTIDHKHKQSHEQEHEHKHEPDSTTSDKKQTSRHVSEEMNDGTGFGTAIMAAPSAVKSLLTHRKNESVSSLNSPDGLHRKDTKDLKESKEPSSAVTRFFKGVRNEGSKVGEFIFRRDRPAEDSDSEVGSSQHSLNESETDESSAKLERKIRPGFTRSTTATSTASNRPSKKNARYHLDLPAFRSTNANEEDEATATDSEAPDHITRQTRERANSRSSRFDELAPPRMNLGSLSSTARPVHHRSPSTGRERINKVLARSGGVGQGGLPVTSLTNAQFSESVSRRSSTSRPGLEKRHWSITDQNGSLLHRKAHVDAVTAADIARIRALFLCSGIKARDIVRRSQAQRDPPAFLVRAAKAANTQLIPVSRKEEHVLAARILVRDLEASTQALHVSAEEFRELTVKDLTSMISNLKSRVESDLFPRVRSSADEAVRITSEISGSAPLAVKQISDEIDKMLRMRRRRMKWVRRVGWMLVEWMLLGIMWCAWLIVVVLGSIKRIVGWNWGLVRWLLWI
jgi:hypothetical protein